MSAIAAKPLIVAHACSSLLLCGCVISLLSFGPRSSLGFFLTPLSQANGWGRDVFAFALALQNLLWGIGQPFAGAIADQFGHRARAERRVRCSTRSVSI